LLDGLVIYAQSEKDAEKYRKLGTKNVSFLGNLKFDAPALPYDKTELEILKGSIGGRPVWVAASTHPEEETMISGPLHHALRQKFPNVLTIIVPRHPERGAALATTCANNALRSKCEPIKDDTQFYIADTIGELGLFYRLSNIVFMGGSLIVHGGKNMLEPARIGCAAVWGPHVFNFEDAAATLIAGKAGMEIKNAEELTTELSALLKDPAKASDMGARGKSLMEAQRGITQKIAGSIMNTMQANPAAL